MKFNSHILKSNNTLSLIRLSTVILSGVVSTGFLLRLLTKEQFGQWIFFLTCSGLIDSLKFGAIGISLINKVSGASDPELKQQYIGAGWVCGIIFVFVSFLLYLVFMLFFPGFTGESQFSLIIKWYPLYSLSLLPVFCSLSRLEAENCFNKTLKMSLIQSLTTPVLLPLAVKYVGFGIQEMILLNITVNFLISLWLIFKKWSGLEFLFKCTKKSFKSLIYYGRFTLGTSIASNLLQSSDVLIITLMLGNTDQAIYSIPLKAVDLLHGLVGSFTVVAFPLISEAFSNNNMTRVKKIFYRYAGSLTLLFIPFLILAMALSPLIIWILGGASYAEDMRTTWVLRIFLTYGVFLSIDRFTGTLLDGINKPKLNAIKVYIMLVLNIAGDIIVITLYNSIIWVALVTILNGFLGIFLGFKFLNLHIKVSLIHLFQRGITTLGFFRKKYIKQKGR